MMISEPTIPQRRRFGLFLLSAYRELRTVYPGGFESFLVALSAAMGNRHTGKPVNVSSIAEMTGIPRPTASCICSKSSASRSVSRPARAP